MTSAHYDVQADLRFLLPLQPGQCVAVIGAKPALINAIKCDGMKLVVPAVSYGTIDLQTASTDHVICVDNRIPADSTMFNEYARVLKPGGFLFIGVSNTASIKFLFRRMRKITKRLHGLTVTKGFRTLTYAGFKVENCYGIQSDLHNPSFIVSLEKAHPSEYYFTHIFEPYSLLSILGLQAAFLLIKLGLYRMLFADLGMVARRC